MTDYKAPPGSWAQCEEWAPNPTIGASDACILELRARVEALERRCEVQLIQLSDLQERHHRLTLQVGHLEHELVRDDDDEPQQHCLEAMDPPEANSRPIPDPSQIKNSLVERVQQATNIEYENSLGTGSMEARAAIREVAAWMIDRRRYDDWLAPFEELADLLLEEAER